MDVFHSYDNNGLDYTGGFVCFFSYLVRQMLAACELVLCLTIHVVCYMRTLALAALGVEKHRALGLVLPSRTSTSAIAWDSLYVC